MKPRIYVDTSVFGGCFEKEFDTASLQLIQLFVSGGAIMVISDLIQLELQSAPVKVSDILNQIPSPYKEYVELDEEAEMLAKLYINSGAIGSSHRVDAQHIAVATVSRVDVLVSWNFNHIVNLKRIRGYNAVNLKQGYPLLEIRTPQEVIDYGNQ